MNSKLSAAVIVLLLVGTTFVAGCSGSSSSENNLFTNPSPSPSPSPKVSVTVTPTPFVTVTPVPTVGPKQVAAQFEAMLRARGFAIRQPLTWRNNDRGNYEYTGTLALGIETVRVTIETFDNVYDTQNIALRYSDVFVNQGYVKIADSATWWTGINQVGNRAWILVNTKESELWVMVFEEVSTS